MNYAALNYEKLYAQPDFAMPTFSMDGLTVLDVGCGNGWALAHPKFAKAKLLVGVDVDLAALTAGNVKWPKLRLIYASADSIPLNGVYDVVMSRVALPYTDIRAVLTELYRLTKTGGDLFLTMHDWRHQAGFLADAIKRRAIKRIVDHAYIVAASFKFMATGTVPTRPGRDTRETFQTEGRMRKELMRVGFSDIAFNRGQHHWTITARKI
jgi:ubiquinone/menaquinone biosynthesis C-methylase UbiE